MALGGTLEIDPHESNLSCLIGLIAPKTSKQNGLIKPLIVVDNSPPAWVSDFVVV